MQRRTRERREAVIRSVELGQSRQGAASAAGVSRSTLYRWLYEDPRFGDDLDAAEGRFEKAMLTRIGLAAANGSGRWAAWLLERRFPDRWRPVTGVEVSGDVGMSGTVRMESRLGQLDDDELEAELARLRSSRARRGNRGALPLPRPDVAGGTYDRRRS